MDRINKLKRDIKWNAQLFGLNVKDRFANLGPRLHEVAFAVFSVSSIINKHVSQGKMEGAPIVRVALSIMTLALTLKDIKESLADFKTLKLRAKVVTIGNLIVSVGSINDVCKLLIRFIAEAVKRGASNLTSLTILGTVMGSFSVGVQVLSGVLEAVELRSLFKQSKKFKKAAIAGTQADYLVEKANKAKGLRAIFNPITENQTKRISNIFNTQAGELGKDTQTIATVKIQRRFKHLKALKAISIALSVLSVVGMLLLMFAPTPVAPIAWGVIGTVAALSIARIISGFAMHYRFSKYTKIAEDVVLKNKELQQVGDQSLEEQDKQGKPLDGISEVLLDLEKTLEDRQDSQNPQEA